MALLERCKLTNRRVKELENDTSSPIWIYDADVKPLAVSVSPLGKKTFYAVVWSGSTTVRRRLGTWPEITLDTARREAKGVAGDVARRRNAKAALDSIGQDESRTVGDLFAFWLETHSKRVKRTWARDVREYDRLIRPVLHHIPLVNVTRSDVVKLVANVEGEHGKGPAGKARALLSTMFETAIAHDWMDANPVRGTPRPKFDARQRYIKPEEIGRFFAALDTLGSDTARDFFKLCLFTGQRRSNVAALRWEDLDLTAGVWIIPARQNKSKKPHTVPLSAPAVKILRERQEKRRPGVEFVLPGRGRDGHYTEPKEAWKRVKAESGIGNIRIHDLRRSLGAWQNAGGASLRMIQQTLGHSSVAVTAAYYTPVEIADVRRSVDKATAAMLEAVNGGANQ